MAIADHDTYYSRRDWPYQRLRFSKSSLTTVAGRQYSGWLQSGVPAAGSAPTTAAVPTSATTGALGQRDSTGVQRILRMNADVAFTAGCCGMVIIADRLSHQGGLGATTTGAQTTNLPTAALTRKTTGVGVEAALEIYTTVGTTGTTSTISYTNAAGTSGQTSRATTFGGTSFNVASRMLPQALAVGDTGVQAVASVTLAASTLTAGNFGVTLYYPLVAIPIDHALPTAEDSDALYGFGCWFPQVDASACLQFIYYTNGTATGIFHGEINIAED